MDGFRRVMTRRKLFLKLNYEKLSAFDSRYRRFCYCNGAAARACGQRQLCGVYAVVVATTSGHRVTKIINIVIRLFAK